MAQTYVYPTASDLEDFIEESGLSTTTLDLDQMIDAGIAAFEYEVGRTMYAASDTTRRFDPTSHPNAYLDLRGDLAAITSLTIDGSAKTIYTDYVPLPENNDEEGRPWHSLVFKTRYSYPLSFAMRRTLVIVGKWAYSATSVPPDAFVAMMAMGALSRMGQIAYAVAGGLVEWKEADVSERYGDEPLKGLRTVWQGLVDSAVARYKRRLVG